MRKLAAMLLTWLAWSAFGGTVEGTVTMDGGGFPGANVAIANGTLSRAAVTDKDGRYRFPDLPRGSYEITFAFEGAEEARKTVEVNDGIATIDAELKMQPTECAMPIANTPCSADAPATPWDQPRCADYELNSALIRSAKENDRSAIDLLRQRHATTTVWSERARIASALLGKLANDSAIWNELQTNAENLLRFSAQGEEAKAQLEAYCAEHDYPEEEYINALWSDFFEAGRDPRGRSLVLRALEIDDSNFVVMAIMLLGEQHEEGALPTIAKVLEKREDAADCAQALAYFRSPAADELAMKYMTRENERARYRYEREGL
ncbi:MAG: carboxypeptidase regulatory-like domain-containing protein [Acidobacteria bacterium]|nr:carboxypeptidase regulatory-like domain-containing protein [Acidobacteriota bacterium]